MSTATPSPPYEKLLSLGTKIVAVGRNYAAHAKELGNAVPKIPEPLESLDHEVELAVVISKKARDVPEATAMDYVGGYALGLDMTAREIQASAKVDGEIRQKGSTEDMIFKIPYLISHISSIMTLLEGDVILTGTPQGCGPVKAGQKITAGITGLLDIHFDVGQRKRP
ncbi:hypothetical protein C3L33_12906, partial [Rhododendron williamsianum]